MGVKLSGEELDVFAVGRGGSLGRMGRDKGRIMMGVMWRKVVGVVCSPIGVIPLCSCCVVIGCGWSMMLWWSCGLIFVGGEFLLGGLNVRV